MKIVHYKVRSIDLFKFILEGECIVASDYKKNFEEVGVNVPEILLPVKDIDLAKWSVVACDQYTSQPEYWHGVEKFAGDSPSTLHMVLPEVYLEEDDIENRINNINEAMRIYLSENILVQKKPGFILIDRKTSHIESRKGLVIAVDLENYDYKRGSQTLIRATEGTVIERIPPRVKIRQNAALELPHIMLLIDDPQKTVIEPLFERVDKFEKVYDFDLMMGGAHITGYRADDEKSISDISIAFKMLAEPDAFRARYGVGQDSGVLLFAVGDGNHSLASAKAHWQNVKAALSSEEAINHPSRFALVEVVNVHDSGIRFEPIHRVVFNVKPFEILDQMVGYYKSTSNSEASYRTFNSNEEMNSELDKSSKNRANHVIPFIFRDRCGLYTVENPKYNLEVGTLQAFLDKLAAEDSKVRIDYIHGEDVAASLGSKEGNIGFLLPPMNKHHLFRTVVLDGTLPRKTFSMGEAEEKRFYLECRKIIR